MRKKDYGKICNNLNRNWKRGIMLSILMLSMILTSCSYKNGKDVKIEISMEDAIAIGMKEANKYYSNLSLTEIHSYDNDYVRDKNDGEDGLREWWYVDFANEELNYVSILIRNGEIISIEKLDENWNNGLLDLSEIKLTSKEAVQKAKELGMRGGNPDNKEEWISGYNFKLSYASLIESPNDVKIFLEVIAVSSNGNFAHADFDATTGELILAEEKVVHADGSVEWKII